MIRIKFLRIFVSLIMLSACAGGNTAPVTASPDISSNQSSSAETIQKKSSPQHTNAKLALEKECGPKIQALRASLSANSSSLNNASGLQPDLFVQLGHSMVTAVAISPSGLYVLSGDGSGITKLWEVTTGREIRSYLGHNQQIDTVAFSPDERHVLSSSIDGGIKLWNMVSGNVIKTFEGFNNMVRSQGQKVTFSPDGRYIITKSTDLNLPNTMKMWETSSGMEIKDPEDDGKASVTIFTPDGRYGLMGHSVSGKYEIKFFEINSDKFNRYSHLPITTSNFSLSPDGQHLVTSGFSYKSAKSELVLRSAITGKIIKTLARNKGSYLKTNFSPDGLYVTANSGLSQKEIWKVATGKKIISIDGASLKNITFSPNGRNALISESNKGYKTLNLSTGKETLKISRLSTDFVMASASAYSKDGNYLLLGEGTVIKIFSTETGKEIQTLKGDRNSAAFNFLTFSPDASQVASHTPGKDGIYLWNIITGGTPEMFSTREGNVPSWVFADTGKIKTSKIGVRSSDGRYLLENITDSESGLRGFKYWDLIKDRELWTSKMDKGDVPMTFAAFAENNRYILSPKLSPKGFTPIYHMELRDVKTGHRLKTLSNVSTGFLFTVALSPNGCLALSGGDEPNIKLWDVASETLLKTIPVNSGRISSVAFSPDERFIISGDAGGSTRLWNVETGKEVVQWIGFEKNEWIAVTPEGFFDSSKKGDLSLSINLGLDLYNPNQFRRYLYQPEVVKAALKLGSSEKAVEQFGFQDFTLAKLIERAPVGIKIASLKAQGDKGELKVQLEKNKTTTPERITVYVNGAQVLDSAQRQLKDIKPGDTLTYPINLPKTKNHVKVLVENKWAESSDERWIDNANATASPRGTLFVNAVGISKYPEFGPDQQLVSPPKDAENIVHRFKQLEGKLFDKVEVSLLTDTDGKPVTSDRVAALFKQQSTKAGAEDTTLFFLAGHGVTDVHGDYQFVTADTKVAPEGEGIKVSQKGTSFDWSQLHSILDETRGKRLVFVDTCQAGKVLGASQTDIRKLVKDVHDVNAIIYTGTSRQQLGLETAQGGVFTQAIVGGMNGKAKYQNSHLFFTSLKQYVDQEVPRKNIEILESMSTRGILIVKKDECNTTDSRGIAVTSTGKTCQKKPTVEEKFDTTQHPVAVIPEGMGGFVIGRQ